MSVKAPHLNKLNQETLDSRKSLANSQMVKSFEGGDRPDLEEYKNIKIEEVPTDFSYGPPIEIDGKKTI